MVVSAEEILAGVRRPTTDVGGRPRSVVANSRRPAVGGRLDGGTNTRAIPGQRLRGRASSPPSLPGPGPTFPRPGQILTVGRAASVQFAQRPLCFRLIRYVDHEPRGPMTWMTWIQGHELDDSGDLVNERQILVRTDWLEQQGA